MYKFLLTSLTAFLLSSCGALDISFEVQGDIGEQEIAGNPLGGLIAQALPPIPVEVDIQTALAAQDVSVVQGIFLEDITLQITPTQDATDDDNFDFIDELVMRATADDTSLPEVEIARLVHEDDGSKTLVIVGTEGVNLKDYVLSGMNIETEVSGSAPITDTSFDGSVRLTVEAL